MDIDRAYFRAILADLVEEDALACQGVLAVSRLEFTSAVATCAVTLHEDPPRLLVNLDFIRQHCRTEIHVKTLLLHEFLHVLLNHTGDYRVCDPGVNLALDAVVNHIIHRVCGPAYSEFCRIYYAEARGWQSLLSPPANEPDLARMTKADLDGPCPWAALRQGLFRGTVLADDILDLARQVSAETEVKVDDRVFLGNHDPELQAPREAALSPLVVQALDGTFRRLCGGGIFRDPTANGFAPPQPGHLAALSRLERLRRWESTAAKLLRSLLLPDARSLVTEFRSHFAVIPVLNGTDRRGVLRALWSPILPEITWNLWRREPVGTAQVYLDVSGSMNQEMTALVTLLNRMRRWIRSPFWAFSDLVAPAVIEGGQLRTSTTGGTSMNCVLEHLARTRPAKALVITDGYIEACDPRLLREVSGITLHALVSRHGNPARLEAAGIPCTQLSAFPN